MVMVMMTVIVIVKCFADGGDGGWWRLAVIKKYEMMRERPRLLSSLLPA